MKHKTPEA